jgi:hypothetical protein
MSPPLGSQYLLSSNYDSGQLLFEVDVPYTGELEGFASLSSIYIYINNQHPVCDLEIIKINVKIAELLS